MSVLDKIQQPISKELKIFKPYFKKIMSSDVPLLSVVTNFIYRKKGKQLRPMLVFLSSKLIGEVTEKTYTAAGLIELLHTATLIHDDVVDESYQRRGFFSINALWKSKIAVLVGDYFFAKGLLLAMENEDIELLRIVSEAVKQISEGELVQIQKSRKLNLKEEEYYEIIRKKTATLFAACTAAGIQSNGANSEKIKKMKEFGELLGIAFQIKDDIFDYQSNSIIGKPTGNDLKEKKLTLPIIHVLEKADTKTRNKIRSIISKHNKNNKRISEVIKYVIDNKGLEYSYKKMMEYKEKAKSILMEFKKSEARDSLEILLDYITERKK